MRRREANAITTTKLKEELPVSFDATRSNSRHEGGASTKSGASALAGSSDGDAATVKAWGDLPLSEMSTLALGGSIAALTTVLDSPIATKDRPRLILAMGSRQLQTARSSRAATGGDAASNSDKGDGAASETRTASKTPGSAIITDVSCLAQLRGWLRGDGSGGNLGLLYSSLRDGYSAAVFHS